MFNGKKRRALLLVVAAALVVSTAGCSGGDSDPSSTDSTTSTTAPGSTVNTDVNFGGREFIVVSQRSREPVAGESVGVDNLIAHIEECEQKYDFTLSYMAIPSNYHDVLSSAALGGEYMADIWYSQSYNVIPGYAKSGLVYALDELGVTDFSSPKWIKGVIDFCTWKGHVYGFMSQGVWLNYQETGIGVFFNKDLFEREGMASPYDMVDNNTWTWDAMKDLAVQATKDTDGDGENDQFGLGIYDDFYPFLVSNGGDVLRQDEDGTWKYTLNEEEGIEALEYFFDLNEMDIHAPWLGDNQSSRLFPFKEGKVAMLVCPWYENYTNLTDMADDYGWVPFPIGPSGDSYRLYRANTSPWVIPVTVENPKEVLQMYDLISEQEDWANNPNAYQSYVESRIRDDETMELFGRAINENWNVYSYMDSIPGLKTTIRESINTAWSGEASAKTAADAVAQAAQALIDETLNNG